MNFTHLHVHTEYSLLDGSSKIKEVVSRAKELGMDSLAITDHGVMYGVIDFYKAAKEAGIRPVIGCEIYVSPGSRFDREQGNFEDRYYHLVLLAENNKGYSNLMKIVSKGFVEGFYYKPRVDYEVLEKYHEGIIALSACLAGEVQKYLARGLYEEGKEAALKYEKIFGKGNFFLELQDHGIPEQKSVNQKLLLMSKELGIDLVCTNDVHYTYEDDAAAHDILLCIQTRKKISDEDRMRYEGGQYYLKSPQEMKQLFPYASEALENTHKIAERCNVEIEFGVQKLPKFEVPAGYTAYEYLRYLCEQGLKERYKNITLQLNERLQYELDTISSMGFVDYFLIVWDFIHYAKSHGIAVGPGRGSAAGSIVAYSLEITDIDPIKYNLLFERFLNPERVTMPDIDIDFCFERRQEVIQYVNEKYGSDKVAQIVTFGTLAARVVIRDVGRVLDMPYAQVDSIAKMIPKDLKITIEKALLQNLELKALYDKDEQVKYLLDMSMRLEGLPRQSGMHAAGVVICQEAVDEFVPLSRGSDGSITTQFVMTTLEELGLLKMDFLGLRTLTVIQNAVKMAEKNHNVKIDLNNIDYNDKEVLNLISSGATEGIFQLESSGMKNFMKELLPNSLEDIIAGISLYRPGPMDFIPKYLKGKNNPDKIVYDCDALKPILEPTHGCIVYQEQVMQIVRDLAGFTLGRSDTLRRAMSKKKADVMEKERQSFVYGDEKENVPGCIKNGISEEVANKIYDEMIDFAKYAFNKSHAAAYSVVSYQTAYLKRYYPVEFMAALMTSVIDRTDKISEYILTCRNMDIEILPPDVNESGSSFSVRGRCIRYGLSAIKSVGPSVIETIVAERDANGVYTSLSDFVKRLSNKEVNKRTLENFIKAGALDSLGGTRKQFMQIYLQVLDAVNNEKKTAMTGQMSLFDMMGKEEKKSYEIVLPPVGEYDKDRLLEFEKEVLGIYVSGHPLERVKEKWEANITCKTTDFIADEDTDAVIKDQQRLVIGGIISSVTKKITKRGQTMAFITLEDLVGTVEVIIFPKEYEMFRDILTEDSKIFVVGEASVEADGTGKVLCKRAVAFEAMPSKVWIQCNNRLDYEKTENQLLHMIKENPGNDQIGIFLKEEKQKKLLSKTQAINATEDVVEGLKTIYGDDNVKKVEVKHLKVD